MRLLIDSDVALGVVIDGAPRDIDDAFAIVEAINCAQIDLVGVTTVFGNAPQPIVHEVAQKVLKLQGNPAPLVAGAKAPLSEDGRSNPAVEFLADQLRRKPAHLAAIGPLTNVGLLVKHYPEVVANILSLLVVAGRSPGRSFRIGEVAPVMDFNFENDVEAARLALSSGAPVVLLGFELTSQVVVTEQDLITISQTPSETARLFHQESLTWCHWWTETFPADSGFHPWDSAAISWLRRPENFLSEPRGWHIRSEEGTPWLECSSDFEGPRLTFCTGFRPGGASAFIEEIVTSIY